MKENNRHSTGRGNGKIGKKLARIKRAKNREPRSEQARMAAAGFRERSRNGW